MNKLLYILFLSIFLSDFLADLGVLSHYVTWFPTLLSMLVILIVFVRITVGYGSNFPPMVSVFLILLLLNITVAAIANHVSAGPLIAGIRMYLQFIPFFILPFIYRFSEEQLNKQLKLLFFLFIIQTPISLYQRLVMSKGLLTGDFVKGTFGSSGQLTVALTSAIAMLMAFFLAKRISFKSFIGIFFLFFIPLTINETKSTIIFFPIAFCLPLFFSSTKINLKQLIPLVALIILAGISFVIVYDYFMRPRWGYGIIDFLSMEGRAERYVYKGADGVHNVGGIARVDSWVLAVKNLSENIINLCFGFGIGNVSESFIPSLSGEYATKYSVFNVNKTSLTLILWEFGILGAILYYFLIFMSFKCSRGLGIKGGLLGSLSNGWSVISILIMGFILYSNVIFDSIIGYLFWYFSGYIISEYYKYNNRYLV